MNRFTFLKALGLAALFPKEASASSPQYGMYCIMCHKSKQYIAGPIRTHASEDGLIHDGDPVTGNSLLEHSETVFYSEMRKVFIINGAACECGCKVFVRAKL